MPDHQAELTASGQKIVELVHDLSNHLNRMVLQASCLQLEADEKLREDIEVIRQEGIQAAALAGAIQQIGNKLRAPQ
ncbi:MAG TPA: hypothetical protein VKE98_09415 [Gemmataceae bacterium]|nr:hypothetical protein [Gemmataceae bacterium]